jgi:hypothetical protein
MTLYITAGHFGQLYSDVQCNAQVGNMHSYHPHTLMKFMMTQYCRNSSFSKYSYSPTHHYIISTHCFFVHSYNGYVLFRTAYFNLACVCVINYRYASQKSLPLTLQIVSSPTTILLLHIKRSTYICTVFIQIVISACKTPIYYT